MAKYLDETGLAYFWAKIKEKLAAKADSTALPTKTSDLTNDSGFITAKDVPEGETDPTVPAWAKAESKPSYTAAEVGALPDSTHIPSTVAELSDSSDYAKKSDLTNVYKYKGSVAAVSDLPSSGNTTGDVYNVEATDMNYAWNGTAWDPLGQIFSISSITNTEIDTVLSA